MAQYTLELRELVEFEGRDNIKEWFKDYDLGDYLTSKQIEDIEKQGLWDKDKLADLIIDHYYMREIGFETPALFKLKARVAMKEIMEEKAPLIWSSTLNINPLNEFEIHTESEGETHATGKSEGNGLVIHSNTPQGNINKNEILTGVYASDTNGNESESTTKNDDSNKNSSTSTGRNRSEMLLIREYRDNIRQINREIIDDLADLFIGVY